MLPIVRESLKAQSLCPKCGANWVEIEDSLYETIASENYQIARIIIDNCEVCGERFKGEI